MEDLLQGTRDSGGEALAETEESACLSRGSAVSARRLTILHFNDCYNVDAHSSEPIGGAARFAAALADSRRAAQQEALVLFSGDILSPSVISTVTKGDHMIAVLQACGVEAAVLGNHEFDFGLEHLSSFVARSSCRWLLSNLSLPPADASGGCASTVAGSLRHAVIRRSGLRIGLIGLIESEWLASIPRREMDELVYEDFVAVARRLASRLRHEDRVDLVVALTHMRWPNDRRLAIAVPEVDLILGGHDHDYEVQWVAGTCIVKSGSDFRSFSRVEVCVRSGSRADVKVSRVEVTSRFPEDAGLQSLLARESALMQKQMDRKLAVFSSDLDCRFALLRSRESQLGNLVADVARSSLSADVAILTTGGFRCDCIHYMDRSFTLRDLTTLMPMVTEMVLLAASGQEILAALENGVCKVPALEGRFPCVSGISFAYDPEQPSGGRVDPSSVLMTASNQPLERTRVYRLATKRFQADGGDGYTCLTGCTRLAGHEECATLNTSLMALLEGSIGRVIDVRLEDRIRLLSRDSGAAAAAAHDSPSTPSAAGVCVTPVEWKHEQ